MIDYSLNIGKLVVKRSGKPFKSGLKTATVKDVVQSPYTEEEAYTFIEDDSIVNCCMCEEKD